jgi:hypothetical protein
MCQEKYPQALFDIFIKIQTLNVLAQPLKSMRSVHIIKNPVLPAPGGNDKFTTINSFDLLLNPAMIGGQKITCYF